MKCVVKYLYTEKNESFPGTAQIRSNQQRKKISFKVASKTKRKLAEANSDYLRVDQNLLL